MAKSVERDKVIPIAKDAAKPMQDEIKRRAPQGPTGNMRKSVKIKPMSGGVPIVLVAIDQKTAPHWKFHEWGTDTRRPGYYTGNPYSKGSSVMVGKKDGTIYGTYAAPMPVTAPFRRGVSAKAQETLKKLHDGLNGNLSRAAGLS
ncbi:MAG: hypothetical protein GY833_06150 [Aestuariibacter sp.]|nr:hypothetical protein [Aestuariibacter sp.]